jgi:hypothetical protein
MPIAAFDANTIQMEVYELCDKLDSQFQLFRDRQLSFSDAEKRFNEEYRPQAILYLEILKLGKLVTQDEENVIRCGFSEHNAATVFLKVPEILRRIVSSSAFRGI